VHPQSGRPWSSRGLRECYALGVERFGWERRTRAPHYFSLNPIGAKGLGEIAFVGVAPAIANAVYHATGQRMRDLPITLDKLL
jgi:CO/xanthine dehydrogenase Mo-binding subunit